VEIAYTLHLPDGTHVQEKLPLVVGVIADLTGDAEEDRPEIRDPSRDFRHIHKDNFDDVLAKAKPHLKFVVPNAIRGQGEFLVDLHFRELDDFHPDRLVQSVPELRAEQERRKRLENLLNLLGSDPMLEARLQEIVDNPQKRAEFLKEMSRLEAGGPTS
jgi:type VI secretion system protein ImpB